MDERLENRGSLSDEIFEDRSIWVDLDKAREETAQKALGTSLPDGYYPVARRGGFMIAKRGVTTRKYRQGV